jgi:hypothetical protein
VFHQLEARIALCESIEKRVLRADRVEGRGLPTLMVPYCSAGAPANWYPPASSKQPTVLSWCFEAHVFIIAFLAYCLHVTLARRLYALAPWLTARSVLEKFAAIRPPRLPRASP